MCIISHCNINSIQETEIEQYLKLLPSFMALEIKKYQFLSDRKSRLLGRLMLLKYLKEENKACLINNWKRHRNNKPYLDGWKSFNISHSGDIVIFCFSQEEVGVDIEKKIPLDFSQFTSQFSLKEEDYILKSANVLDRFYEIWVRKEAVLKAEGVGIVNGLNNICCLHEEVYFKGRIWHLTKLDLHEEYTSFLCSSKPNLQLEVVEFKPGELMV